jgi:hypothetical protein
MRQLIKDHVLALLTAHPDTWERQRAVDCLEGAVRTFGDADQANWLRALADVSYALASHFCFPHSAPMDDLPPGAKGIATTLVIVNGVALVVACSAAVVALWSWWHSRRDEGPRRASQNLLAAGVGRTRFLAACGGLANLGFVAAIQGELGIQSGQLLHCDRRVGNEVVLVLRLRPVRDGPG